VAKIPAQDEPFYGNSAIHMAVHGDWLTPRFMDRYSLYKPPLALWLAAASARIFGVSRFSLRLPLVLLCSLAPGIVFLLAAKIRSPQAGAAAALLIISNHLRNVAGPMVLTDALLATFAICAMYCVFADPRLDSRWAFWGFAVSVAAGILAKTIAGALPLAAFALWWWFGPRESRAPFRRACAIVFAAGALAAPWFLYQMVAHHHWFWTEHVLQEILGFGTGSAEQQTTGEEHVGFYFSRVMELEPALFLLFAASIPAFYIALRKQRREAIWLACWLAPVAAAPFVWGYRNATYLIPSIAPMAIAAACYWPKPKRAWDVLALVSAATAAALLFPAQSWGLSFASGSIDAPAPAVSNYCEQARGNELISVEMKDDLYAAVLPLARLRYAIVSPSMTGREFILLDFAAMGISVTPDQFNHLEQYRPIFQAKLREAGQTSGDPIGTLIVAPDQAAMLTIVPTHPLADFLFPDSYRAAVDAGHFDQHEIESAGAGLFFLLARTKLPRAPLPWPCRM
jgi:4-amino-4-deoxy-L-arabinose transferase-like glycosyltransferase